MLARTLVIFILLGSACFNSYGAEPIIISGHTDYPPFMYRENDQIIGVGPDLTKLIFAELGIAVESHHVGSWGRVLRKAESGEIDLIVGAYKTTEREVYLSYPQEHYLEEPVAIFINKNNPFEFTQWQDLKNKLGGTVRNESFGNEFDNYAKQQLNIQRVVQISHGFKMMVRNRLDYVIYALYPGKITLLELGIHDAIDALPKLISAPKAYQAFSKKSKYVKHLDYFSNRVKALKQDGTIQRLIDKHMARFEKRQADTKDKTVTVQN